MRRSHIVLVALVPFAAAMTAHAQFVTHSAATAVHPLAVDDVLARVMMFDRNGDGKVAKAELVERMQPLVARGDVDGNESLDAGEIRALARAPRKPLQVQGLHTGGYGFADEEELSSRSHIENTLDDLRLDRATRDRALAVALSYVDGLEKTATADLLTDLEALLTTEQLADAKQIAEQQLRGRPAGNRIVNKLVHVEQFANGTRKVFMAGDLEARILSYQLPAAKAEQARAAAQRFKTRLRLGPEERSQLLAALDGALGAEERENFAAAVARRPVVQSGGGFFFGSAQMIGKVPTTVPPPAPDARVRHAIFVGDVTPTFGR